MLEFVLLGGEYVPSFRCYWCGKRIDDPKLTMAVIGPASDHENSFQMRIMHKQRCSYEYEKQLLNNDEILQWFEFDTTITVAMDEAGFNMSRAFKKAVLVNE